MKFKKRYLKYIGAALCVLLFITAAFMLLKVWESRQGQYSDHGTEEGVITHEGQEYVKKDRVESFLVIGLDRYEDAEVSASHGSGVQADFLMLFVFDNETKQSTAVHINRDSMTKVNKLAIGGTSVVDTYTTQIALAYNYANDDNDKIRCRNTKDSVQYMLGGIKVDHYFAVTMDSVPASCDLVGGIEVEVLDDFTGIDDTLVKGEKVTLTGERALRYVRTRYGLEDSSNSRRMERQQQYIEALYSKIVSRIEADDNFIIELVDTMDDYVAYDSSDQKLQKFIEKFDDYEFLGIQEIEGESKVGDGLVEFYPDEDAVRDIVIDLFYKPKTNAGK